MGHFLMWSKDGQRSDALQGNLLNGQVTIHPTLASLQCSQCSHHSSVLVGVTQIDITNVADSGDGSCQWKETDSGTPCCLSGQRRVTSTCFQPAEPDPNTLPRTDGS